MSLAESDAAIAWKDHVTQLWNERLSTYGLLRLPTKFDIFNKFVGRDVLSVASDLLKNQDIPISLTKPITSDKRDYNYHIVHCDVTRPPSMHELNITHNQPITYSVDDPFWTLNKYTKNRVFTLWRVSGNPIYTTMFTEDEFEMEIDVNDTSAYGGCLYVSYEGNPRPPYKIRIPGNVRVPG
jgi:hypothetical protein